MSTGVSATQRFTTGAALVPSGRQLVLRGTLPGEGAAKGVRVAVRVNASDGQHRQPLTLTEMIAEGGEGAVFKTSLAGHVAKIYKREKLTEDRLSKLKTMIARPVRYAGICFPVAIIYNTENEFVGYLMPEGRGVELGRSIFVPQLLLTRFPGWNRRDTVKLCITILEKVRHLNDRGVILGDINPANILISSPSEVYFVDCDSYQVEGYPCSVGTAHFSAPEVNGRDYKTFLRTQAMENFAVATLLFMIMLPGKAPYSAVDGGSPAANIKSGNFPYPHMGREGDAKPPRGKWGYIWSHMSYDVRLAFFETFKAGEPHFAPADRYSTADWIQLFDRYHRALRPNGPMVRNDPLAVAIFPTRVKMKKCKTESCENRFIVDEDNYFPFCDDCVSKDAELARRRRERGGARSAREERASRDLGPTGAYKSYRCRNAVCTNVITLRNGQGSNPEPAFCQECWQDAKCTKCGFVAKKWMHDERQGLCRQCHEARASQPASTGRPASGAVNSSSIPNGTPKKSQPAPVAPRRSTSAMQQTSTRAKSQPTIGQSTRQPSGSGRPQSGGRGPGAAPSARTGLRTSAAVSIVLGAYAFVFVFAMAVIATG